MPWTATYLAEVEAARLAAAGHDLDETFFHSHRKVDMSVRWAYLHMIERNASLLGVKSALGGSSPCRGGAGAVGA